MGEAMMKSKDRSALAKKVGYELGYRGRNGGWIYRNNSRRASCQGWYDFGIRLERQGYIRRRSTPDGSYGGWETTELADRMIAAERAKRVAAPDSL